MRLPSRLVRGSVRPDRASFAGFASMRWAALPVIDRRWTAPLSAVALGFGLFVGVAIGPGVQGGLGTTKPMVIQIPAPANPQTASAPPASTGGSGAPSGGRGNGGEGSGTPQGGGAPGNGSAPVFPTPPLDTPSSTPPITPAPPISIPDETTETDPTESATDETEQADEAVEPSTSTLAGTVVHLNPHAVGYTIATDEGSLIAVHSRDVPTPGKLVQLDARSLPNGTYAEEGKRKERGNRGRATLIGTVTFNDPVTGVYTVSATGVSLLVRGGVQRTPPDLGEQVEVEARIADNPEPLPVTTPGEQGCGNPPALPRVPRVGLEQVGLEVVDAEAARTSAEIEAIVEGVCRDSRRLIVSADDVRESGHDLAISIPKAIRLAALKPGQVLKLGVEIGAEGALALSTVAGDEGAKGAEDTDLVQP